MSGRYTRDILEHLNDRRYQPRQFRELSRDLGISDDQFDQFRRSVEELIDAGQVVLGASNTVVLPPPGREMVGLFHRNERGFGFITPDSPTEHGDLFVPTGNTGGGMTGDLVRAQVIHRSLEKWQSGGAGGGRAAGRRSPYVGRVVEVIRRAERKYVGNIQKNGSTWTVQIDGKLLHDPVVIHDPQAHSAKSGDKVVVELVKYPTEHELAEGVITEVLGEKGEPAVETIAVMRAFGLADQFPEEVLVEAREMARSFDESVLPDREDLRSTFVLTIDPPDARDFDDAISISRLDPPQGDNATYELGVHIADVSHFVPYGSALDREAYARGNSTYLPGKVLPMLPELLSNGVCSLQEQTNRASKSVFLRYDASGHFVGQQFTRSLIRSAKRLTYLEAQALIDGDLREAVQHARTEPKYPSPLVEKLRLVDELAKLIRQRRITAGMIELDLPAVELVFDDSGRVIDAMPEDDAFTHRIIEMFMVEANEASARLFDRLDVPIVRRIHPDPATYDMKDLRQFARVAGYNIPSRPTRQQLQKLLDTVRGKPAQMAVHMAVLKTFSRAEYSPLHIGHFALASEHYAHFTSPIRRYPDLLVHRALDAYLDAHPEHRRQTIPGGRGRKTLSRKLRDDPRCADELGLTDLGRHCSATERNSEAAERNLRNYLVLELVSQQLGEDFDGIVTGVTRAGIYIQIGRYMVDGFVRVADLPGHDERWNLNRVTGALVAQGSGKAITIGDRFVVRVANVDPAGRRLELVIVDARSGQRKKRRQNPGARQALQRTQKLKQLKKKDRRQRQED